MSDSDHEEAYVVLYDDVMFKQDEVLKAVLSSEVNVKCYPCKNVSDPPKRTKRISK